MVNKAILVLAFLFTAFEVHSQCGSSTILYHDNRPDISIDDYSTLLVDGDTVFVFNADSAEFVVSSQIPDTSKLDGRWLLFYRNNPDSVLLDVTYEKGVIHGVVSLYNYPGGKLSEVGNYKFGVFHGEQLSYREDGTPYYSKNYDNGILNGETKWWHANDQLWIKENYKNGLKHGAFYRWDEEGRITKSEFYINDQHEGSTFYFVRGKLRLVHYFEEGRLVRGVEYFLIPSDTIISRKKKNGEGFFTSTMNVNDEFEFIIKEEAILTDSLIQVRKFYPSGQLRSEEFEIDMGEVDCTRIYHKTGRHRFWNEAGELLKVEHYQNDVLIKSVNLEE